MSKFLCIFMAILFVACGSDSDDSSETKPKPGGSTTTTTSSGTVGDCLTKSFGDGVPAWVSENFDCVQVTVVGTNMVIATNNVPNHNSYYFGSSDSRYEAIPTGNSGNPNLIVEQDVTFTIPMSPVKGSSATETSLGPIGFATNGLMFFDNQAGPGDSLAAEAATFDSYEGHPENTGMYHYHVEPPALSDNDANLIGVLRDGFPVFGLKCPATNAAPTDLDTHNGHIADTGISGLDSIYHYHLADMAADDGDGIDFPVVTNAYAGTPGELEQ